jgi:hypothetical protein
MCEMAQHPGDFEQILVHTGQHYDANMSQVFFDELELPVPGVHLAVGFRGARGADGADQAAVRAAGGLQLFGVLSGSKMRLS